MVINTEAPERNRLGVAIRGSDFLQEAIGLAADGELGNTDAIRLLQIPHRPEDVRAVLQKFEAQLSREAKSKLTLDALVPLPDSIDNQRYEPIFDKYLITGETYTTAGGIIVPNELQYYNGEMVHLYGECANVARVNDSLAGSGYKAMTLERAGAGAAAVAQIWSINFTDSTIRPYSAMFIVVVAVPTDAPAAIEADSNDASSVVAMLDGSFDQATAVYENKARLFMVRLLDTTRVAIEVGRERMGTDKRPGTIDMTRDGRRLRLWIKDGDGRGVVRGNLDSAADPAVYLPEVAKAAAAARISFRTFPRGTEYSFPAVARIGQGPIVSWQWRSDLAPRLQPVMPNTIVIDASSEEGGILQGWGFKPTVLGYIPNVRGVVTGLAQMQSRRQPVGDSDRSLYGETCDEPKTSTHLVRAPVSEPDRLSLLPDSRVRPDCDRALPGQGGSAVNQPARDGSVLSWSTSDMPAASFVADPGASVPISVAVSPIRPGHVVTVDYRLNGGPVRQVTALPEPRPQGANARVFRATIPGQSGGLVEFLPVLRLAGQPITPRLGELADPLRYEVRRAPGTIDAAQPQTPEAALARPQPKWVWDTTFLGSLTAGLRKELIGVTPDGLRIDWHVTEGSFVGPGFDMVVLPGAADWMRIRKDGIGIVNVQVCLETRTGERVFGSYGGMFDLGPDGYSRALRDEYDRLPPVVVTPTYATAVSRLQWLNRAQCLGVGRVDMKALRVEFDVYMVRVGGAAQGADTDTGDTRPPVSPAASLYTRMGGYDVIAAAADDFIAWIIADKQLARFFVSGFTEARVKAIRQQVVDQLCALTGGSCVYTGRDMKTVHRGLGITEADWKTAVAILITALTKHRVPRPEQSEFMQLIEDMKGLIVEKP